MKIVLINGLLFCLVFARVSAATEPDPGADVYENGSRDGIQRRRKACRNLGGWCIKTKRDCPNCLTSETQPGRPYCSKSHRCCYPDETDINVDTVDYSIVDTIKCGIETTGKASQRIINGKAVTVGGSATTGILKYSWQVGLKYNKEDQMDLYFCGGSIINDKHVLTAAHCLYDIPKVNPANCKWNPTLVYVGIGNNQQDDTDIFRVGVRAHFAGFDCETGNNDIAILELDKSIDLSNSGNIHPICLPKYDTYTYAGENAIVSGWGSMVGYNPTPTPTPAPNKSFDLMEATIPVMYNAECKKIWPYSAPYKLTNEMLCGSTGNGYENGASGFCFGDSGGPLTIEKDGQHIQIGIVSLTKGCVSAAYPQVYARVTKFLTWIGDKAGKIYTVHN